MNGELFGLTPEVRDALAAREPVVALESTIIAHGMPYPQNAETARAVEAMVREQGAVPATIAVLGGRIRVGLDASDIERLATEKDVVKASSRDLAACAIRKLTAGTTVAATMSIAAAARISVFATGGIGGVHRGAEETFDISADLAELARNPVAVVSAGCKSILDIGKTLEKLETLAVPVIGYRTDEFPAFFARNSGHRLDHRLDTPREVAELIAMHRRLSSSGVLIANPIPQEHAFSAGEIDTRIAAAAGEAKAAGISRKDVTPYLLTRINELTGGKSLTANIALVRSNATLAAQIAVELASVPAEH